MDNIQDLKDAEWAFNIFNKCVPEKYRKVSIAVLVGKYSDRNPSDSTIIKIGKLQEQWIEFKIKEESKGKQPIDFVSYVKYYFNAI